MASPPGEVPSGVQKVRASHFGFLCAHQGSLNPRSLSRLSAG